GTAVGEKGAIQSRLRTQLFGQQALVLVVVKIGNVDALRRLVADNLHDAWVGMAERINAQSGEQVEIAPAVNVVNVHSLPPRNGERIASVGIQQVFLFQRNNFFIRQHDDDLAKVS